LERLCAEIRKGIDGLAKIKGQDRGTKITFLQNRIARAKQVFRSFKVELRDVPKAEAEPYVRKMKDYNENINQLIQDLTWASEKADLMDGAPVKEKDLDNMTADQIVEVGAKKQDESIKSLDRTLQTIEASKGVASDTAQQLSQQTDQLRRIGEGVDEVEINLKEASRQLRSFARRIATDKIIMLMMLLVVLAIIVVIILSIVKPGATKVNTDQFKPKN